MARHPGLRDSGLRSRVRGRRPGVRGAGADGQPCVRLRQQAGEPVQAAGLRARSHAGQHRVAVEKGEAQLSTRLHDDAGTLVRPGEAPDEGLGGDPPDG